ncbi:MAG: choice-of-anchor protein [Solirubrobacterales bacterium]|nr:choice-of-anchor protein [Solirubrobacterales bacterium]
MNSVLVPIRRLVLPVAALALVTCGLATAAATAAPPPGAEGTLTVAASASFATTSVGATSTQQISLKNESEAGVDVNEVGFEGVDPGDFGIEGNNCVGFIGPSMNCTLTVRFTPGAGGLREARLRVATDGTQTEYLTELSGEGAAPELTFEPAGHDFGLVEMHSNSPRTSFTLRNSGTASVQLGSLEIFGPDANEFFIQSSNCWGTTLAPGATCQVEVQFNANEEGSFTAAVSIRADNVGFTAPLAGRAERPKVEAFPTPLVFGPTSVGSSQTREVTLTNVGHLPVGFFIAIVSGGDQSSFHMLEESCTSNLFAGSPRMVEPGASCVAKVEFDPTRVGATAATLSFFGAGEGALEVPVEGTGVAPRLSLSPSARNFGSVAVGNAGPTQTFQLRNESIEAQTIDSATLAGADVGDFGLRSDECSETVLAPGATCAVAVRFDPGSSGPKTATLRLRGTGGTTVARLDGEGTGMVVSAATASGGAKHGHVVLSLMRNPRAAAGKVSLGRARCESSSPCTIRLNGLASGRIATVAGPRPALRPLTVTRLRLAPSASVALTAALPAELRGSPSDARLTVVVHWRTGSAHGAASRGVAVRVPAAPFRPPAR